MKIAIDLQPCQTESRYRGTGRYSLSLAKAMISEGRGRHEFTVVLNNALPETVDSVRSSLGQLLPPEKIMVFRSLTAVSRLEPNDWRCQTAELVREYFLEQLKPDIVYVSGLFEGYWDYAVTSIGQFADLPTAATLYDLTPLRYPEVYLAHPLVKSWYERKLGFLRKAQMLFSISENSKRDAVELLDIPAERIINISADADPRFKILHLDPGAVRRLRARYGLTREFVLNVATGFNFHKNIKGLMEAYAMLPTELRKQHQLVVCCRTTDEECKQLVELASGLGISKQEVVFTGYISDEDLVALYNTCKLFVFPSLAEGFGLPALEAMRCGAPVIGSNRNSIPEVIGLDEALFDPTTVTSIYEKMYQGLADNQFRIRLLEHGRIQAGKFSWKASAIRSLKVIEEVRESRNSKKGDDKRNPAFGTSTENVSSPASIKSNFTLPSAKLLSTIASLPANRVPADAELAELASAITEDTLSFGPHRLLLDVGSLIEADGRGGISRVTDSIVKQLICRPPEGYRVKVVHRSDGFYRHPRHIMARFDHDPNPENDDSPVDVAQGDIFLSLFLDVGLYQDESAKKWLRYQRVRGLKVYSVVYDLLPLHRPDWFPPGLNPTFRGWLANLAEISDGILCDSRTIASELRQWLDVHPVERLRPLRIGYFYHGADIEASFYTRGLSSKDIDLVSHLNECPTVLMVGILYPRKGHAQTISAMEKLWEEGCDIKLLIVGTKGWSVENLVNRIQNHPEFGKRLFWLDQTSDELLLKLYQKASVLLMPSEGEGFGIPIIEAARYKLPIIARDLPVFREVAGDNAFYFSGTDGDSLANAIKAWLDLYKQGKQPHSEGIHWLTWEESSNQIKRILFEDQWLASWELPFRQANLAK